MSIPFTTCLYTVYCLLSISVVLWISGFFIWMIWLLSGHIPICLNLISLFDSNIRKALVFFEKPLFISSFFSLLSFWLCLLILLFNKWICVCWTTLENLFDKWTKPRNNFLGCQMALVCECDFTQGGGGGGVPWMLGGFKLDLNLSCSSKQNKGVSPPTTSPKKCVPHYQIPTFKVRHSGA